MGQQQSKDELLYRQVRCGNIERIKALRNEGAGLECIDRKGKTPLIVACMKPELHNVARTLIELGANVNAYRAGCKAGTPLHHAAKRGLQETVKLLLSHGANALLMNDACQTPLDVARIKGYSNIVRAIESHICLFSGWLRELYGPGFLEVLAPQLLSRKVWVVVLPCGSRTLTNPFNLELAIYSSFQDAEPRTTIALWKANIEEPNFHRFDSTVTISDSCTIPKRKRHRRGFSSSREAKSKFREIKQMRVKLAPEKDRDKQQLQQFCNACKGISQEMHPKFPLNTQASNVPAIAQATAPRLAEDAELAMAINASLPSHSSSAAHVSNSWTDLGRPAPSSGSSSWWQIQEAHPGGNPNHPIQSHIVQTEFEIPPSAPTAPAPALIPSAPLIADVVMNDGPANYVPIDSSPVFLSYPTVENLPSMADKEDGGSSSCVICSDAPIEGACVPCGHMAGCMSCLSKIKAKKSGCPVCRAKIDRVIRLYAV